MNDMHCVDKPFLNVEDFTEYHGIRLWVGYGEFEEINIYSWIIENYIDPEPLIESLYKGKINE